MTILQRFARVVLVALAALTGLPALAQPSPADEAELRALVETLKDEAARQRLIGQIEALLAARRAEAEEPPRLGARLTAMISERLDLMGDRVLAGAQLVELAPGLYGWLVEQAAVPNLRAAWLHALWTLALILAAGFSAEWLTARALAGPRRAANGRAAATLPGRIGLFLVRTLLDVLPIVAFAVASYLLLPVTEPGSAARIIALALVNANVAARVVIAVVRVALAPYGDLRIVPVSSETANYLYIWARRFTNIGIYGYFLVLALVALGVEPLGADAVAKLIGFVLGWMLVVFILQNRVAVADFLRGRRGNAEVTPPGVTALRQRLADVWHVLAILYVVASYTVWLLDIDGGFEFIARATLLTAVVLVAARVLAPTINAALTRLLAVRPDILHRFPGLELRANRYLAILHRAVRAAIYVVAGLAILQAWGISTFAWVASPAGQRIAGSVATIVVLAVLAVMLWEMVSSAIERHLAQGTAAGTLSPRARTLLPLMRNVVLVVLGTIVALVVLSELGINIGPLLAGAGVLGLAVGFGAQTLVKDVISGFFIMMEDQFSVGDVIKAGGRSGLVEDITIRTVRLRDLAGTVHVIPFSEVTSVENMTKGYSRYVFDVGIAYREDTDAVSDVLRALGQEMQDDPYFGPLILQPLEVLGVDRFEDSAVIVRARITTLPIRQWEVGREFNRRMKRRFDELGIEIPFPHRTLWFGVGKDGTAPAAPVALRPPAEYAPPPANDETAPGEPAPKPER